ncbi:MAG: hypothetical protein MRZ79_22635 [Bacteroidia bacterium]|nr:hypothetical protein [Bacteroidia bacterium]
MNRRRFLGILMMGAILLGLGGFFLRNKVALLQAKLESIGFEVEKIELEKFWKAWMDFKWGAEGRIWKYYLLISMEYLNEPRDETVRMFLLSSNALNAAKNERIKFEELYHPYKKVCAHPFAQK